MAKKKKDKLAEKEARLAREAMLATASSRESTIKWVTIGFVGLLFVVMVGLLVYNGQNRTETEIAPVIFSETPNTILPINSATSPADLSPVASDSAVAPNEVVELVEFADLQCPACMQYHPTLRELTLNNPNVKYVFKHFPLTFHQHARRAAMVAEAAGVQGKFFEMLDLIYANQSTWSAEANPSPLFLGYAQELGLNMEQFTQDLENEELANRIQSDVNEGQAAGVGSTPTFFFNGKKYPNVPNNSVEAFEQIIQQELSK